MNEEMIVGIDLGTTNSEIAAYIDGKIRVIESDGSKMLPSCVGLSPTGELLVGASARNQQLMYPELTVRSIKREMGTNTKVQLGDKTFTPQEISALILRELVQWATLKTGIKPTKAVITVPAYFSDAQRQATREAGVLAGLEITRILNEPTAASLVYGKSEEQKNLLVYDLGGGTFDVSIVRLEGDITEVLASHGNNKLGGDDFTQLLMERMTNHFLKKHKIDLSKGFPAAYSRLWWIAEQTKKKLSSAKKVEIKEENLIVHKRKPYHLEMTIEADEYEAMIRPLLEGTIQSVTKAMTDAGVKSSDLDEILLVGGSTRTPLVHRMLEERSQKAPKQDIHPDLCVALGAGLLASRQSGLETDQVLVDISPYSFGISHLGDMNGETYPHCYTPTIEGNTALPVTRAKNYWTSHPYQEEVEIVIYQGEDPDALRNLPVGSFMVKKLTPVQDSSEIILQMKLDLDGILNVSATEKSTGKSKEVTIEDVLKPKTPKEIEEIREKIDALFAKRAEPEVVYSEWDDNEEEDYNEGSVLQVSKVVEEAVVVEEDESEEQPGETNLEVKQLLERSRNALEKMHEDDKEEAIDLHEIIDSASNKGDKQTLEEAMEELRELLFFVEGK